MTNAVNAVVHQAIHLSALERANVVEKLLHSLDFPDQAIDQVWAKETDARVEAYERGEIESVPAEQVFAKYAR